MNIIVRAFFAVAWLHGIYTIMKFVGRVERRIVGQFVKS